MRVSRTYPFIHVKVYFYKSDTSTDIAHRSVMFTIKALRLEGIRGKYMKW